jgi:hypothetical protein
LEEENKKLIDQLESDSQTRTIEISEKTNKFLMLEDELFKLKQLHELSTTGKVLIGSFSFILKKMNNFPKIY